MKTEKLNNLFLVVTLMTQISCTTNNVFEPFLTENAVNNKRAIPQIEEINVGYEHNRLLNMYAFCIENDSSSVDTISDCWNDNNIETWATISYLSKKKDKDKDKDKETKELKKKIASFVKADMTGAFMGAQYGGNHGAIAIGAIMSGLEAIQWE